jgi:molybdate-binding protein
MRLLAAAVIFAICPIVLAQGKADYGGLWKKNCQDEMGLQFRPLANRQYAILFCKTDICSQPGAYRPNTRIDGDPLYEVLNATTIKVRYPDGGFSVYRKCGGLSGTP